MATRIKPNTTDGKEKEQAALMRASTAEVLLTELDADVAALSGVADTTTRQILRNLLQRQRRIIRRISSGV